MPRKAAWYGPIRMSKGVSNQACRKYHQGSCNYVLVIRILGFTFSMKTTQTISQRSCCEARSYFWALWFGTYALVRLKRTGILSSKKFLSTQQRFTFRTPTIASRQF